MRLLLAAFCVTIATCANAQDMNCDNWADLPQQGMNRCSYLDYQKADLALNQAWPLAMAKMKALDTGNKEYFADRANGAQSLLKAQRGWIDYRDGHCEAEGAQYTGGSIQPLIINTCKASLTRKRTEELLLLLEEG